MLQRTSVKGLILMTLLLFPLSGRADDWEFVAVPYGLLPSISGDASLGRVDGADVDVSGGDILKALEFGAMIQLEAHNKSGFGALINYGFMELGDSVDGPAGFTEFDANLFQGTLEGYGTYRTKFESSVLDAYAGVRWWDMDIDVDVSTPLGSRSFSRYEDWVDPVIGVRWIPSVAEEWRLILQGDIGGFGVSSDFSWNVQAGALWDVSQLYSVVLMYRALAVDYNTGTRGTKDYFAYDTITHGPLFGVAFRF